MRLEDLGPGALDGATGDSVFRHADGRALGHASPLRLSPQQLYQACDAAAFPFQTTAELEGLAELMGQMRAVEAVLFAAEQPLTLADIRGYVGEEVDVAAALAALAEHKRGAWTEHAERLARLALEILKLWHGLQKRFKGKIDLAQAVALDAMLSQAHRFGISVYESLAREFVKVG